MGKFKVIDNPYGKGSGFRDGVYYSKRPSEPIPSNPFLDWTTYTFDHPNGDRVALVDAQTGESITYRELKQRSFSVASGLADVGVKQGDVVMILSPNSVHFPVLLFAITYIGAVVTTVNPANVKAEILKQVKDSNTSFLITVPELVGAVDTLKLPLILIDTVVGGVPPQLKFELPPIAYLSDLYRADPNRAPTVRIRQTDTAVLLYSSGTTGVSKGVKLSHGNVIAASCISEDLANDENEQRIYLTIIPMYHVYGMVVLIAAQLKRGSKLVILPKYEFSKFLDAIQRFKVTHCGVVPPILVSLVKSPLVDQYDLSSLLVVGVGAAPCGKEIITAFSERFKDLFLRQGFGMTETTAMGATTPAVTDASSYHGAVGLLAANFRAKIVDVASGKPLLPKGVGELWLQGPAVMQGYLNNEKATAETIDKDGWLHTGDIGYFDDDGYLYIVDRLKELIKYNGFQVAPAELEAILLADPRILSAAVAGFPNEKTGQIPVAFIVRAPGSSITADDVMNYIAGQVAPYKRLRRVIFVDAIPVSTSGKILRRELKSMLTSRL